MFFFKIFESERQFLQNTVHHLIGKLLQNGELSQRKGREVRVLQNSGDASVSTYLSTSTSYPQKQVVWFIEQWFNFKVKNKAHIQFLCNLPLMMSIEQFISHLH